MHPTRSRARGWRTASAIVAAAALTTGALVAAAPVAAAPASTSVWPGKSDDAPETDPGGGGMGSGKITITDPASYTVADPGDTITLAFEADCWDPFSDGNQPFITFALSGQGYYPEGEWTTDGGLETYTGTVEIAVTANNSTLVVNGSGTPCFWYGDGDMQERLYTFYIDPSVGGGTGGSGGTGGGDGGSPQQPAWRDATVANGVVGQPYSDGVQAPVDYGFSYWIDEGQLPAGLTLDDEDGTITGVPTQKGCQTFRVGASGEGEDVSTQLTICILPAQSESPIPSTGGEPSLGLSLQFKVGDSIRDARTKAVANGLKPDSPWTLTMYSTPRVIGSGYTDAQGTISQPVALPLDTPAGAHRLVLSGIAPDGSSVSDTAWFAIDGNGIITALSETGPVPAADSLASTGAGFAGPGLIAAALALLSGAALLLVRRRRAIA